VTAASAALRSRLTDGPALLLDAAMGTELERRGAAGALPLWSAAALLDAPRTVRELHSAEVEAGADVLTANTFRTHGRTLATAGLGAQSELLTWRAVSLAREAAAESRRQIFVVGSLSPLEDCYRPDLAPDDQALAAEHELQAGFLAAAGVDGIFLETHNSVRELRAAAKAARATGLPVVASIVTDGSGRLLSGEPIADAAAAFVESGVDAAAINCVPAASLENDLRALAALTSLPLGAYANLGRPGADGSPSDPLDPDAYARIAGRWLAAGARLVGGCCGTGPAHTAALRRSLDSWLTR
jgi:S-methylmethionine-dependent homocysteine/selenocysteine methylase